MSTTTLPCWVTWVAVAPPLAGFIILALYATGTNCWAQSLAAFGTFYFQACAAGAVGTMLGFIFAIPRFSQNKLVTPPNSILQNDNLADISDWLTKLLIGAGLVGLRPLLADLNTYTDKAAEKLTVIGDSESSVMLASIIFYVVAGFIDAYMVTRLFLPGWLEQTAEQKQLPDQPA